MNKLIGNGIEEDINKLSKPDITKCFFNENKLKEQLQALQGYITDLSEENDLLVETIEELENESNLQIFDFNSKFCELSAIIEKLEKENVELNLHKDKLQSDVNIFISLFKDKSIQPSYLEFKSFPISQLCDEGFECEIQTSKDNMTTLEVDQLKEDLENEKNKNDLMIHEKDLLIKKLQDEISECDKEKQALSEKIFKQDQLLFDLQSKSSSKSEEQILMLEKNINELKLQHEDEQKTMANEKIALQKSISELKLQLEDERKIMTAEVANQYDVASKLRDELSECKIKFEDTVKQVRFQGEIIVNLRKDMKVCEQQNMEYRNKLLTLEATLEENSLETAISQVSQEKYNYNGDDIKKVNDNGDDIKKANEGEDEQKSFDEIDVDDQKLSSTENVESLLKHQVEHIDQLEKYITELEEKLHASEKIQADYENTITGLKVVNQNAQNQIEEYKVYLQEMNEKLDSSEKLREQEIHKNSLNEEKMVCFHDETIQLRRDLEYINAEVKAKNILIDQATTEGLTYKQKYAEKDVELQNQLVIIKQLEVNYEKISNELLELRANACEEILFKEQKILCLSEELEMANLRYSNISEELTSLETELENKSKSVDFSDDLNLMKTQLEVAQEDIHQLEMGLTLITEKHEALLKENVVKDSSVINLQTELDVTQQEFEHVIDDIDNKTMEIERLTIVIGHLQKSCQTLEAEKDNLEKQVVTQELYIDKLQTKIQLLEENNMNSSEQLEKLKIELEKSFHDISTLNQKLAKQSDYLISLENLLVHLKKDAGETKMQNNLLEDTLREIKDSLDQNVDDCNHYKTLYSKLNSEYKSLEELQKKTQNACSLLQKKNTELLEEIDFFKTETSEAAEQVVHLQNCFDCLVSQCNKKSLKLNSPTSSPSDSLLQKKIRNTIDQFELLENIFQDYMTENKNLSEKVKEYSNNLAVKEMHLSQKINELTLKLEELYRSEHALKESDDKYNVILDKYNVILDEKNSLLLKVAAMEKALKNVQSDLRYSLDEEKNKEIQVEKLHEKIKEKDKETTIYKSKIEDLSNENQSYQDILMRYERQLNDAQNQNTQLSIQLEQKCRLILAAQESIVKLQKRAECSKKEISNSEQRSAELELSKLSDLHKDLIDKYKEEKSSNNQLHEELNSSLIQHQALLEEVASKDAELRVLKTEWQATKNKCHRYENELKLSKDLEENLMKEKQELQNSYSKAQQSLVMQGSKRKKLENYLKKTLDKLSASENEVCRLSICTADLKKEMQLTAEQQRQCNLTISELEEKIVSLKYKVKDAEENLIIKEEEIEMAKNANSKLNHEKSQLHAELHEIQKELEGIRHNRNSYSKEYHDDLLQANSERSYINEQEETISQLRTEVRELKTALINERNIRSHTIDDLQKRIKMYLETIQQLHKQLSDLSAENFRQKELLDWQAYSRKNLHDQLKTQEKDLSSLRENLNRSFEEIMVSPNQKP
ncbi:golgin subfamily B member 1 isoform X12 [Hydra vulgaris]|uniref:Golgin subfamily B member 1 isoform X12 n=1 Tax=Hydra vulgaris TaxID=6087 RepID=A0ABM4DKF5_HYDVU